MPRWIRWPGICGLVLWSCGVVRSGGLRDAAARVTLVLDAGALVAVERDSRELIALIKRECLLGRVPVTHGGVVGQLWRGGSGRQARLAQLLPNVEIVSLDADLGKRAGANRSRVAPEAPNSTAGLCGRSWAALWFSSGRPGLPVNHRRTAWRAGCSTRCRGRWQDRARLTP